MALINIVNVAGKSCNLNCRYCLYKDEHTDNQKEKTIISFNLLKKLIIDSLEIEKEHCGFIWHGGDSLFVGWIGFSQ